MNIDSIVKNIKDLQKTHNLILVGIDGRSGSGKSSLAKEINAELESSIVMPLDKYNLYEGEASAQKVIHKVIKSLKREKKYKIAILEGIFIFGPILEPYFDYKIWVDSPTSQEEKEEEYIKTEKPKSKADVVVDDII